MVPQPPTATSIPTAPSLPIIKPQHITLFHHHLCNQCLPFCLSLAHCKNPFVFSLSRNQHFHCYQGSSRFLQSPHSSVPRRHFYATSSHNSSRGTYDPELRAVLELATEPELYELESILFGPSYFSPLLKSISTRKEDNDYFMIGEDLEEREEFISMLEARFLYLAADARSTLRGWRPSYRDVLLRVRKKLKVPCSGKLPTEDLEVEIFLHVLQEYSSEERVMHSGNQSLKCTDEKNNLERGLSKWKIQAAAALGVGAQELRPIIMKGGWMFTLGKIYNLLAGQLSGKMFLEAAKYQIKNDVIKKGGQLVAMNLESRAALLAAKQGLKGAASRYIGLRSMITFLGPMMWGTFLADMVIQMLGTDYARILRAIYAFAQIRILRTYRSPSDTSIEDKFL